MAPTGDMTIIGGISADGTGSVALNSVSGNIVQNSPVSGGSVDYDAGNSLTVNNTVIAAGEITLDAVIAINITAAGDINASGTVTFGADKNGAVITAGDIQTSDDDVIFIYVKTCIITSIYNTNSRAFFPCWLIFHIDYNYITRI